MGRDVMESKMLFNKKDIVDVRPEIKKPLFEVIRYMKDCGWDISISAPLNGFGSVSFTKNSNWHQRAILSFCPSYGYRIKTFEKEEVENAAQRAAELCLTVYDMFINIIPDTENIYGDIKPCLISNKEEYMSLTYEKFKEKHEDKQIKINKHPSLSKENFQIRYYGRVVVVNSNNIDLIYDDIVMVKRKLLGESAMDL